jgi:group I intron endonuclease
MEKKYYFVYITTNLLNGKQYIGDHSTNNLNDNYLGSGRPYFQNALNEYGLQNFKREILEFFNTKEEAFNAQEKYIQEYNTLYPNGYNLSPIGGVGFVGCFSEETKEKMSKSRKGNKNGMFNKKHTEEAKRKQSNARKGKDPWNKGKTKIYKEETIQKLKNISHKGEKNPMFSKHHKKESLLKMSNTKKGKKQIQVQCPYCNKIGGIAGMKHYHFENCKNKEGN